MASQEPYSPVPNVRPDLQPVRPVWVNTPEAAFGGATAQALGTLGKSLDNVGNELATRALAMQQLHNETAARNAMVGNAQEADLALAKFRNSPNQDLPAFQQQIEDIRQKWRKTLNNPMAQERFDGDSSGLQIQTLRYATFAASDGLREKANGALQSQIDQAKYGVGTPGGGVAQHNVDTISNGITQYGTANRWSPEKINWETQKAHAELGINTIKNATEADDAQKAYDDYSKMGYFPGEFDGMAKEQLYIKQTARGAPKLATDMVDAGTKAGQQSDQIIKNVQDEAKAKWPDNANAQDAAVARARTLLNTNEQALKDASKTDEVTISHAFLPTPDGRVPDVTTVMNDPKFKDVQDAVERQVQRNPGYMTQLEEMREKAAKADWANTPQRTRDFNKFHGEAIDTPAEFVVKNVWDFDLNWQQRQEFIGWQKAIREGGGHMVKDEETSALFNSAAVQSVIDTIPNIHAAENKSMLYNVQGEFAAEVNRLRAAGKTPTLKEAAEIATTLATGQAARGGWFWLGTTKLPMEMGVDDIPKDIRAGIVKDYQDANKGRQPNDDQIVRYYRRHLFNSTIESAP